MPTPESLIPLKPLVFDVLLILERAECHGYGIAKELEGLSPTGPKVLPGNLYRTLTNMIGQGLIDKRPRKADASEEEERRRYFKITAFGRRVAKAEAERLRDRVAAARAQSLLPGTRAR